ncbi:MAG TPA: hypothetical protein VF101_19155 [Gaiellaceae bacterium]
MSFLRYMGEDPDVRQPAWRLYARVDQVETTAEDAPSPFAGDDVVLLDSVGADWFDETRRGGGRPLADAETVDEADQNISVVEMRRTDLHEALGAPSTPEDSWIELKLETGREPTVLHYPNLFAAPLTRSLASASWAAPPLNKELAEKTSMDDVDEATDDQLRDLLTRGEPDAVAVYDVGQGNCNAALNHHAPVLYFDLGGGVLANRKTFPTALTDFCFTYHPTIVLSHWDWDHWSSANRDLRAYNQPWIVPQQGVTGIGAVHRTFLARLLQNRTVLAWPSGRTSFPSGPYEIFKCTGPAGSRNDSGLALVVERTTNGETQRILLPGDCAYRHVPHASTRTFTSIVAAHHGGRTSGNVMPQPDGSPSGRVVYSYGRDNQWGHPFDSVRNDYTDAHWYPALETSSRCPPRSAALPPNVLGHVHLHWEEDDPDVVPGCGGGQCQLGCHQR